MKSDENPAPNGVADPSNSDQIISGNARFGLILFAVYLAFYGGFVSLNAFAPAVMGKPISAVGGVNLAVVYGVALIIVAFVMAIIYMFGCKREIAVEVTP